MTRSQVINMNTLPKGNKLQTISVDGSHVQAAQAFQSGLPSNALLGVTVPRNSSSARAVAALWLRAGELQLADSERPGELEVQPTRAARGRSGRTGKEVDIRHQEGILS